jgi:predicted DNA-binding transcriptional regulator YafY
LSTKIHAVVDALGNPLRWILTGGEVADITMRAHLRAPIEFDKANDGYRYSRDSSGDACELPGLWFSSGELHALLMFDAMLQSLEPGLLGEHLAPFRQRVTQLLEHRRLT